MEKYFELSGKTAEGRPLIHLVEPGSGYGLQDSAGLTKTASGEHMAQVIELVESIQPQPNRLYLVNSALGAGEWVGFNLRGDWFTERGLVHTPPGWDQIPLWDIEGRRRAASFTEHVQGWGGLAWGYPTFYNASRFQHHANKDPSKARGFILGAFYDPRMHRVVLVSELVRDLCVLHGGLDVYERAAQGEFPDTSMGAKVPADRCSVCNNVARSPAEYCEHVRRGALPPYGMRAILPDGRMCGVYNDYPRFFDDSFVFIGAERSAKVMANVTKMVRGNHVYTARLYAPGEGSRDLPSREALADVSALSSTEQGSRLGEAVARIFNSRVRGPTEGRAAEGISQVLSAVPTQGDAEAAALRHAQEVVRNSAALKDSTITPDEYSFWEGKAIKALRGASVSTAQQDRALALLRSKLDQLGNEKLGSLAKWAELIKRIPVPSGAQTALLRDHIGRLTPVLPRGLTDQLSASPTRLWSGLGALGHLGVVLRPSEFQECMLNTMGEHGLAEQCNREGLCFSPTPLDVLHEPRWLPDAPRSDLLQHFLEILGPILQGRSFAPTTVAARIVSPPKVVMVRVRISRVDPVHNQISQMYNDYRTGLLTKEPDWGYVPSATTSATLYDKQKVADAATAISSLLLHLAYW